MSVNLRVEPARREEWRIRQYAEEYGSPSHERVLLSCNGKHEIEIIGGSYDYEEGGIIEIRVDGVTVFGENEDKAELWAAYWKKHPKQFKQYDDM